MARILTVTYMHSKCAVSKHMKLSIRDPSPPTLARGADDRHLGASRQGVPLTARLLKNHLESNDVTTLRINDVWKSSSQSATIVDFKWSILVAA